MSAIDSVLLVGFGGPTAPDEVMPFLENVVRGRNVPRERLEEVAHHYHDLGGRSPYNDLVLAQADALHATLCERHGLELPVYVGMRNWHPFLTETLARMSEENYSHTVGITLAAHRSPSSGEQYERNVADALAANRENLPDFRPPSIRYVAPWYAEPGFIEANACRIEEACPYRRGSWPADVSLVFTAHSIPTRAAEESPYLQDLRASCKAVAGILAVEKWQLAFQSRSGDGRIPWLEPDINEVLRALALTAGTSRHEVVVQPIGFLQDHVEVLFDLDVEAKQTAQELGWTIYRAATAGNHPAFIEMLADRVANLALP